MERVRGPIWGALLIFAAAGGCSDSSEAPPTAWNAQPAQAGSIVAPAPHDQRAAGQDTRPRTISFDDLEIDLAPGQAYDESLLTDRIRELDGCRVVIRGFMYPSFQQAGIREFVMLKNTECRFGPGEPPHHVMLVVLRSGETTSFTVRPLALEGRLSVSPYIGPDGTAWALYRLDEARVR